MGKGNLRSSVVRRPVEARRAVTMVDLLVAVLACLTLLAFVLPVIAEEKKDLVAARCASNLRQIALAMQMYANHDVRTGRFPRTRFDIAHPDKVTAYTNWKSSNSFAPTKDDATEPPDANDVTASLYLVLKTQDIESKQFACPGDKAAKPIPFGKEAGALAASKEKLSNFPGREYLSYSYNNPFPSMAAMNQGWKLDNTKGEETPLVCDMNPGEVALTVTPKSGAADLAKTFGGNHGGKFFNVAFADAHIEAMETPFCGRKVQDAKGKDTDLFDNLFTRQTADGKGPLMGPPMSVTDAIMLPTADFKPATGPAAKPAGK